MNPLLLFCNSIIHLICQNIHISYGIPPPSNRTSLHLALPYLRPLERVINGSLPKILLLFILKMLYSLGVRKPHGWVVSKTNPLFPVSQRGWNDWYRCKQHRVSQNFSLIWCIQIFISIQMMLYSQWFSTSNVAFSLKVLLYPMTQKLWNPFEQLQICDQRLHYPARFFLPIPVAPSSRYPIRCTW